MSGWNSSYLGEIDVNIQDSPFAKHTPADWALYLIEHYGQIDGDHHKAWVLDQIARVLKGAAVTVRQARWATDNTEYRIRIEPSATYYKWVREMREGEDGPETHDYDEGIAP